MMYAKCPLSLRNVEDLLFDRGIDICHETVRQWWNRFGPMFAAEIRKKRVDRMRSHTHWRWHLDEVYVKVGGEMRYLWRAVDHEGEVLESFVTTTRDKAAALKFIKKAMKRHGRTGAVVTDGLRSYGAALKAIGATGRQETGRWLNNRVENSHQPFRRRERAIERFRRMKALQKFAAVHGTVHVCDQHGHHLVQLVAGELLFCQHRAATGKGAGEDELVVEVSLGDAAETLPLGHHVVQPVLQVLDCRHCPPLGAAHARVAILP